jgi:aldose 1-epimerase
MPEIDSPSGVQFHLASDGQEAVVVEVGGGLRRYTVDGVDVVDPYGTDEICPGGAGQVLVPWPNRIRDGRYTFREQDYQLPITEPATHNAIHGLVRWLRFAPTDVAPDAVTLACDVAAQPGYPWTLRVSTRWSLSEQGLRAEHTATNLSETAAPFGIGVHPYLVVPGVAVDDLVLRLPTQQRLLVDGRMLPMGAARVAGGPYDFTEPRRIGTVQLDTAYTEVTLDGGNFASATLTTADGRRSRTIWADGQFGWWQVYTGDTLSGERLRRSVAIEPMTCPPDAFRSGRDVVAIEPGGSWIGTWGIHATEER